MGDVSSNEFFSPKGNPMLKMFDETWTALGDIGKSVAAPFEAPKMPDAPELPEVPDAPEPEAPTEVGDEGIRKASMRRISKKRILNHMYLTQGQDRDGMTLGGYRKTLAG